MEFIDSLAPGLTLSEMANASGWIREHPGINLSTSDMAMLKGLSTPGVGEKAEKLLLFLAQTHPIPGEPFSLLDEQAKIRWELVARCWAMNRDEVFYLFYTYLRDKKLVIPERERSGAQIAPEGWDYLHRLRHVNPDSQIGFCAMWFDGSMDQTWSDAMGPAIAAAGYNPIRIDQYPHNNRIDDEIIAKIRQSRFVVADFTHGDEGDRGGVYFEAGFALGLGLPVIHTCRQDMIDDHRIHFDNRQYNFVTWQEDKLPDFMTALQNRIEATIGRGRMH